MGSGYFDPGAYDRHTSSKSARGESTFHYSDTSRPGSRTVHADLDPKKRNSFGAKVREALDNADHPESLPIVVVLDVTGSMGGVITAIHTSLKQLYALLIDKGYVKDPQIMFVAVGDSSPGGRKTGFTDEVPLQAGQFESDIRATLQLENMIIEGGGGGQMNESYQNAAWFINEYAKTDAWNKRGRRGYAFFIGDEMCWPNVEPREVKTLTDDDIGEPIPTKVAFQRLMERFDSYFILPSGASHGGSRQVLSFWKDIFDQNVLELDDASGCAQLIATTIGLSEATVDIEEADKNMADVGVSTSVRNAVTRALAKKEAGTAVAKATGDIPGLVATRPGGVTRL
jgi:hypothetical protein